MSDFKDFFISYTGADIQWAEWIAWLLEEEGYSVVIQKWDFRVGENFLDNMDLAIRGTKKTIALLSEAFLASTYCRMELNAARDYDRLFPIRLTAFEENPLIGSTAYLDLVGKESEECKQLVLNEIEALGSRSKPGEPVDFPDRYQLNISEPIHFPGKEPNIWKVPFIRNPYFTGRDSFIESLFQDLQIGLSNARTKVLSGLGGVGKTQLAIEYAYRYRSFYDIVWYIRSEDPITFAADFAALAAAMDLPEKHEKEQAKVIEAVKQALRQTDNWLLIFDNVPEESDVFPYIPETGAGHVLVTSRSSLWKRLSPLSINSWDRQESLSFLRTRTKFDKEESSAQLAESLGDLPLALEQAAAYMKESSTTYGEYLNLFRQRRAELWGEEEAPPDYHHTISTTWSLSLEKIRIDSIAGLDILYFFSFLAPDNIPRSFLNSLSQLPSSQNTTFEDTLALGRAIKALKQYSLIGVTKDSFSIHRLVQHVVRDILPRKGKKQWAERANSVVTNAWPRGLLDYRDWPECEALLPHAVVCIENTEELGIETEVVGFMANQMGLYLKGLAFYDKAEQLFEKALAIFLKAFGENHNSTAKVYINLGSLYGNSQGHFKKAEPLLEKALTIFQKEYGENHNSTALCYLNLATLYFNQGLYDKAEVFYNNAYGIFQKTLTENHPIIATIFNNLAMLYRSQSLHEKAKPLFEEALTIRRSVLGENHPDTATTYNNLAALYSSKGLYEKAQLLFEKALTIRKNVLGENHPDTATSYNNIATTYEQQGLYKKARPLCEKALNIREYILGENHPETAKTHNSLGALYYRNGEYKQSKLHYEKALAINQIILGENHPDTARSYNNLATYYYNLRIYEKAEILFGQALMAF